MDNKSIMFVCHGNICRSPMAELIFKDMLSRNGLEGTVTVSSAATSDEEIYRGVGNPVYPPAREELEKHGISSEGKRAVKLQKTDYENYDLFLCMDDRNIKNTLSIFGGDPEGKVTKLLSLTGSYRDVADPWYSGDFNAAYNDIYKGCAALLKIILDMNKRPF